MKLFDFDTCSVRLVRIIYRGGNVGRIAFLAMGYLLRRFCIKKIIKINIPSATLCGLCISAVKI